MNGSKPYGHPASAARQGENIPAAPCGGLFPLTPALSLGERGNLLRMENNPERSVSHGDEARCSLSLRERVRVRGNGANARLAYCTVPGTVELDESSGKARGFPK